MRGAGGDDDLDGIFRWHGGRGAAADRGDRVDHLGNRTGGSLTQGV